MARTRVKAEVYDTNSSHPAEVLSLSYLVPRHQLKMARKENLGVTGMLNFVMVGCDCAKLAGLQKKLGTTSKPHCGFKPIKKQGT